MISKRLKSINSLIIDEPNLKLLDVGSDHAYLPIEAIKTGKVIYAFASDNKKGPLSIAKTNIESNNLQDKIECLLYDGINPNIEIDIVSICGMGPNTILEILSRVDLSKYRQIIIQSNKGSNLIRKFISDHNYTISNELVVNDDKYYEIISFNTNYHKNYDCLEIKYGPINLNNKDNEFINYLKYLLNKYNNLSKVNNKYYNEVNELNNILKGI